MNATADRGQRGAPAGRRHVVVPYSSTNPSVRTRALDWIARLETSGRISPGAVQVHGPGFNRTSPPPGEPLLLLRNARRVSRGRTEARLLDRASCGVYDIDDGLPWDDGNLPGLGRWWKRPFPRALIARRAAVAADRVIVGNEVLGAWASAHCSDVRMIPTCVEPNEYEHRRSWSISDVPRLGWIGSPATEPYLLHIAPALRQVHRLTGARLEVISGPGALAPQLAEFADKVVWDLTSVRRIAAWDVGIMPLQDGVYERAKCGYKLLQYAASGVPAVASPVGVNASLITAMDGVGPITTDEWLDALLEVINEPSARRHRRAVSGHEVADRYSYSAWESRWLEAVGW